MSWLLRALICLETLLMDQCLLSAFWPVAEAFDWTAIIGHVHVTVFDGINLFSVHDNTAHPIAIRKNSFEQMMQDPKIKQTLKQ